MAKTGLAHRARAKLTRNPRPQQVSHSKSSKEADKQFQRARQAAILLKHVSDPTRIQVILVLSEGERHVGAIRERLGQSRPAVSLHLALLRHGGVIASRRQGKNHFYSLTELGADLAHLLNDLAIPQRSESFQGDRAKTPEGRREPASDDLSSKLVEATSDCVVRFNPEFADDALLKWTGAIVSRLPDVAERHDDYIGAAISRDLNLNGDD